MNAPDASPTEKSLLPWGFINLNQYQVPWEPTRQAVREGILGIVDRLKGARSSAQSPTVDINLEYVPGDLLDQAAPAPDWAEGVPALHQALQDWWQERSGRVQILVGAPYSGTAEIAVQWAATFGGQVLPDPRLDQITSGGPKWLEQMDQSPDGVWIIPHLERLYLRHSQGFGLLRAFIDQISSLPGRFLLVCDSWAWAFLNKALHLEALFPPPLVLAAFDQERLGLWFRGLAAQRTEKSFIFRQADNGNLVVHLDKVAQEKHGEKEITDFLQRLAAFSRGNPGVAYTIWRYSLRLAQDEDIEQKFQKAGPHDILHETVWVEPWSQLNLPALPSLDRQDRNLFVLHTLLLHDGLPGQLLSQVLPFPESQTKGSLQSLRVAGVVALDQDRWRVTAAAYPAVRKFLLGEGYLVDAL
jgi:hypothetical protein